MSQRIARDHAEWLSLIETSGPFLTVPTLVKALPDGLEATPSAAGALRVALAEWREDPGLQRRWIQWVLDELLELDGRVTEASDADPSYRVAERDVTLRPDFVVRDADAPVLLVHVAHAHTALDRPPAGGTYKASAVDRAAELARASGIPLALVTNGARWTLVWSRVGKAVGTCTWQTDLWLEEPVTLRAFHTLLGARRFFSLPVEEGLAKLLEDSADRQQEVTDQLGTQVREAVELLIATLDAKDREQHGALLEKLAAAEVYRGAVTAMMRLVFLFVAEERRLLPLDDARYAETLAASTLRSQLQERADRDGEDPLERSTAAWHRVLALFRAVHGGVEHDALRLPAYGGGLFDPDRYPFLEGRVVGSRWQDDAAHPLPVDDRTMLHLLDALQSLEQGGTRVLLSYRSLDVEQIGHVYEGLLDHTAVRLSEPALALGGKLEPELPLSELEGWAEAGDDVLVQRLVKATGWSPLAVNKLLDEQPDEGRTARLRAASDNDDSLLERALPFHALLRSDLRGDPLVIPAAALYVTQALDRRASGTYYTPRQLAEEVVQHALEPIAYSPGPVDEPAAAQWKRKSAAELLELKVCDLAMGSGAFLVAACRYLAAQVQAAWEELDPAVEWTIFGRRRADARHEPALPSEAERREILALRLVAERCLYGVDNNPMAVEMAKLSLWLLTLAADQPFSFVDHALRAGDSLLGITSGEQLRAMHLDGNRRRPRGLGIDLEALEASIEQALRLRWEIEAFLVLDTTDANRKLELLAKADEALEDGRLLGDLVVAAALSQQRDSDPLRVDHVESAVGRMLDDASPSVERAAARDELRAVAAEWLVERRRAQGDTQVLEWADRDPFHWVLEFPEVWASGGFDAVVGNPPFQGGTLISAALGDNYRSYLADYVGGRPGGRTDLVAYFFLRAHALTRPTGGFGLISTNTIAQGDTRETGLDQLTDRDALIHRAISSRTWPGGANLEAAIVWIRRLPWRAQIILDGDQVLAIDSALSSGSRVAGRPMALHSADKRTSKGSEPQGLGFILKAAEAESLVLEDPRNREVVRPFLNGEDLNTSATATYSRWIIDFRDWPEETARAYPACFAHLERTVKPERQKKDVLRYPQMVNKWWQFWRIRKELYRQLDSIERCIVLTLVSKVVQPMWAPTDIVFSNAVCVFAYDDDAHFGLLSSGVHWWWAVTRASTMRNDIRYTPTDCFETFVQPELNDEVGRLGAELHEHRSALMLDRQEGLTKTYNRFHNHDDVSDDIVRLREIHVELNNAIRDAYGWTDLELGHDFYNTKFGPRFTFAPVPRQEVLDRLLELNHERYAVEERQGLHGKAKRKPAARTPGAPQMELG